MDTKEKLQRCFEKLGFSKTFPSKLHINPSTNFIWRQIISNVKPKKEVEIYKKNIIINRLEKQSDKSDSEYPVQEIEIYDQLKKVRNEINRTKSRIIEKQNKHILLKNNNNSNFLLNNSIKDKNEEQKIKLHLIKHKSRQYESEIKEIENMLAKREISAVAVDDGVSPTIINEHLNQIVEDMESYRLINNASYLSHQQFSNSKKSISSIRKSSKACFSTAKKSQKKSEHRQHFNSCMNIPAVRELFTDIQENDHTKLRTDESYIDISGELLPESCFNFEADDEFLLSSHPARKHKSMTDWTMTPRRNNLFESDKNISVQSLLGGKENKKFDIYAQLLSKNDINATVEKIISGSNRDVIWNVICSILRNLKLELKENMEKISVQSEEICNDDLVLLNFIFIKNELSCLKYKKQVKILENTVEARKDEIKKKLEELDESSIEELETKINSVKLEASIDFLHKEVYNNNSNIVDHQNSLKTLKTKIDRVKNDLLMKVEEIGEYFEAKESLIQKMKICQEDTKMCVRKLKKFLFDQSWADSLREKINTKEIEIFKNYPMDFVKRFCFSDEEILYRNSMKDFSFNGMTPNDILYEATGLLKYPHNPVERIIEESLRQMCKLKFMSSLDYPNLVVAEEEYYLQQLQEKENYVKSFCDSTNILIHSNKSRHILNSPSYLGSNMDLWLEMPFRRFILKERLVDDKQFIAYEEDLSYLKTNKH